jgi:hypothetical protein
VDASASDHNTPVFLLKAFTCPAIEDMDLSRSSGTNLIMVSPFVSGF